MGAFNRSYQKLFALAIVVLYVFFCLDDADLAKFQHKVETLKTNAFSNESVVMGMALGYDISVFKRFVRSLRATGYSGKIILGVHSDISEDISTFLHSQNVILKRVEVMLDHQCTYDGHKVHNGKEYHLPCFKGYPDYKLNWGRFALFRDWLIECSSCKGGVLLTEVRDVFFQRDPFHDPKKLLPLMLFEEPLEVTSDDWLRHMPIGICKNYKFNGEPVIFGGRTMGSRDGIRDYLDVMIREFDNWNNDEKCRLPEFSGDDINDNQAIQNYLYYTNKFKDPFLFPHGSGLIKVVGRQASEIFKRAEEDAAKNNIDIEDHYVKDKEKWQNWLPAEYNLIDPKTGLILNEDGSPSHQVYQFSKFGALISGWLGKMEDLNWPYNKA